MEEISQILGMSKDKSVLQKQDEILLQPYTYISKIPGKQSRMKLFRALNHWLNIPEEKLEEISEIVEMLHNASLLYDDIQDDSILRRGKHVAHNVYGLGSTINAGAYVAFKALEEAHRLGHPGAVSVFIEQVLEAHRGQGIELYWRETSTIPTEADYVVMAVRNKGGVILLSLGLMQLFSERKEDFSKLCRLMALYLQILDDYNNVSPKDNYGKKTFCEDITEGKFSFPIIHAVANEKYRTQLLAIMRLKTQDVEVKKYCISLLDKCGSLQYTRDVLESLDRQARAEVERLGPNPLMESLLNDLASWKTNKEQ